MRRREGPGCLLGCLTRISSLILICIVLAGTALLGARVLWIPDWRVAPADAAAVQAFSQRIASVALGSGKPGPLSFTEAEVNAFLAVKYPQDPTRVAFGADGAVIDAVVRPWKTARTFLPDSWDARLRSFQLFVSLRGKPAVEAGVLRIAPSSLTLGRQPVPLWLVRLGMGIGGSRLPEFPVPPAVRAVETADGRIIVSLK